MSYKERRRRDRFARLGWTALQASLAVVTVESLDAPVEFAPIIAAALSYVKGLVAERVNPQGESNTFGPA